MLGLAGFNSQQAAAAGLAGGRNPFTQQVSIDGKRNTLGAGHQCQSLPFRPSGSTRGSLERREPVRDPAGLPGEAWAGCASGGEEVFSSRNLFV